MRQQSQRVSGRLRVNAPLSFALSVLSPLLARFLRQYPELRLDLSMEDRLVDAVGQGFDVSIRCARSWKIPPNRAPAGIADAGAVRRAVLSASARPSSRRGRCAGMRS